MTADSVRGGWKKKKFWRHKMLKRQVHLEVILLAGVFISMASAERIVRRLDFGWKFIKGDPAGAQGPAYDDSGWRDVQIPHDWSIEGPYDANWASATAYLPAGTGWYRKTFELDKTLHGKFISIEFDGVYNNAEVWINGHFLGQRPFGYIGFQYDLTPYVLFGQEQKNVLAVRVDHSQFADSRWYTGSGIYRYVRLCITDPVRIAHWGTFVSVPKADPQKAEIQIETTVENRGGQRQTITLLSEIIAPDGKLAASVVSSRTIEAGKTSIFEQTAAVSNPALWDVDNPNLYTLKAALSIDGKPADTLETPFGVRWFRFDPNEGFFLNGRNLKLKGVCLHHDAGPVGAAVPEKMWVRRLKALKEIGCNAIRCSHNPPAPEFLDLCDRMGFLVMDEAFDEFTPTKNKWVKGRNVGVPSRDGYGQVFEKWSIRDIQDMVRRDRNHPSIIMWSIGNEIDYPNDPFSHPVLGDNYRPNNPPARDLVRWGKPLVDAVKQLDTARPVTAAIASAPMSNAAGFADILDVVGYNYQEQYYQSHHAEYPQRILYGSENSTSLTAWQAVEDNDFIAGQFLWIGIDYLGESPGWPVRSWTGGLFDLCGFKKPLGWFRQSLWSAEPMVYLVCSPARRQTGQFDRRGGRMFQSHWNWPEGQTVRVACYTNCDQVELYLNDTSLGVKNFADAVRRTLEWEVPYEKGQLKAVARRDGKAVCQYVLQTADKPQKIQLIADAAELKADGRDICHLEFLVTDKNGVRIYDAANQITFKITGPGKIIGLGNGNPAAHESHQGKAYPVFEGRGLAIIQAGQSPGTITIEASAESLEPTKITLDVR